MKNTLDQDRNELYALGDELFIHPQLGYKEFTNKKILTEYFESHGLRVTDLGLRTAFKVSVGSGSPRIGLIAELDAIPTLGHPFANKDDYAAHSCGHSTQCANMAYTLVKLKDIVKKGTVTLYFTPAPTGMFMAVAPPPGAFAYDTPRPKVMKGANGLAPWYSRPVP